jgi:hypothetical protein
VAHLARVASCAVHGPAIDDEAATDAHLARYEDDVRAASRSTTPDLRQRAHVCVVRHGYGDEGADCLAKSLAQSHILPSKVRSQRHEAVGLSNDAGDRDADARDVLTVGVKSGQASRHGGKVRDRLIERELSTRPLDSFELVYATAKADHGCGDRVNVDLEGENGRAVGVWRDNHRWPARDAQRGGAGFAG